jgi:hypothetical protein
MAPVVAPPDRKTAAVDVAMQLLWAIAGDGLAALRDCALLASAWRAPRAAPLGD